MVEAFYVPACEALEHVWIGADRFPPPPGGEMEAGTTAATARHGCRATGSVMSDGPPRNPSTSQPWYVGEWQHELRHLDLS